MRTTAELVGATLADLGVAQAFGVVGSGNFVVTNALRAGGVPYVAARHECGATVMADAYARMSDRLAAATLHQGCGLTNAMTGITEAAKSRTPLLVVTADTAGAAVTANFRIDQDAAVRAVGAVAERVHAPESAVADTVRAYRTAVHERRTVVLSLPLDVQAAPAVPAPVRLPDAPRPVRPHADGVAALAEALRQARRPVFVAGRGARHAGAELRALADAAGALLATSAVAHGLFADSPWSVGISGGFASPRTASLVAGADLVVGWGCALNRWTTRRGELLGGTVAQVDLDPAAFGAHNRVDLGVVGDVAQTARDVLGVLGGSAQDGYRTSPVGAVRLRDEPFDDRSTSDRIDPRTLSVRLDDLLPADRVVAVDSGNFMGYPSAYLSVPDQYGFCFTQAFQSIGLGLATAVGAALARPDRTTVAALGDGGFLMGIAELETVTRLGIPMVVVVYDDAAYGAEIHHFGADADLTTVTFPDTDLAAIARGFGATGVTVRTTADLDAVTTWCDGPRDRPLVIDAKITNDGGSWWLAEAFR
ncbi:thiamine pyrophosphate-binding protein [Actinophytocola oryzae]|uniref:Thiamine pyrophosphate-dependent acetolactate synthase large subunit-like protein n=1 Tax=Actinophytocola oryzae TaxID=502181 RepID=A0A4R7W0K5_9PSEU|nr:thiamine pyrophosphate-binding protein [Actinophytocola oryzae]TDV55057.1 thiamine pyrophosphate-dependent acetolactate synthase large subunit-like protein [Actinophytocola oryzae]